MSSGRDPAADAARLAAVALLAVVGAGPGVLKPAMQAGIEYG